MISLHAVTALLASSLITSQALASELSFTKAREAKRQTDRIMNQLQIPTTDVNFEFPKSFSKAVLTQLNLDLPKIETKVAALLTTQGGPAPLELSVQSHSDALLFKSCKNKIKTVVKKDGQNLAHNLVIIPASSGQITKQNDEWLVEVNGTGSVTLAIELPAQAGLLAETNFEISAQPLPIAMVGALSQLNSGSASISGAQLKAQAGLTLKPASVVAASCASFTPYTISSYKVNLIGSAPRNAINVGASFNQARPLIQLIRPGEMMSFMQIGLTHPDQAQTVFAPNFILEVR